jgi:hypothetical protein
MAAEAAGASAGQLVHFRQDRVRNNQFDHEPRILAPDVRPGRGRELCPQPGKARGEPAGKVMVQSQEREAAGPTVEVVQLRRLLRGLDPRVRVQDGAEARIVDHSHGGWGDNVGYRVGNVAGFHPPLVEHHVHGAARIDTERLPQMFATQGPSGAGSLRTDPPAVEEDPARHRGLLRVVDAHRADPQECLPLRPFVGRACPWGQLRAELFRPADQTTGKTPLSAASRAFPHGVRHQLQVPTAKPEAAHQEQQTDLHAQATISRAGLKVLLHVLALPFVQVRIDDLAYCARLFVPKVFPLEQGERPRDTDIARRTGVKEHLKAGGHVEEEDGRVAAVLVVV